MSDDQIKSLLEGLLSEAPSEVAPREALPPERLGLQRRAAPFQASAKDLDEQMRRRALQLETAAEVSSAASSILDLDKLLPLAVELIRDRFGLYYVGIFLLDEAGADAGEQYAVLRAATGRAGQRMMRDDHRLKVGGDSMIGWCVAHAQARIALDVADVKSGEEAVRFDNPLLPDTRSEMALPLISRGSIIGAMTIQSVQPAAFSGEDITVLQTMADQLANAIENARLLEERERRITELAIVNEIGQALSSALELDELLEIVHLQVSRLFDTTNFYIASYQEGNTYWTAEFHLEHGEQQPRTRYSLQAGLTGHIIRSREPLLFRTMADNQAFKQAHGAEIIGEMARSWLGVPLIAADNLVGVMAIQDYKREHAYSQDDVALFLTIATQVANALENQRLVDESRRRAREMEVLNEVGRAITSVLDLNEVLRQIVDITKARFGHYFVSIALVEGEQAGMQHGSTIGDTDERLAEVGVWVDLDQEQSLIAEAVRTGQPVLADDVLHDPRYLPVEQLPDTRSELTVPIKVRGRIIGALDVQSNQPFAYDQADVALLQSLASQAGVALENARLFQETQHRVQDLGDLYQATQAVGSELDLDILTDRLVDEACRLIGADYGVLVTLDPASGGILHFKTAGIEEGRCPLSELPQGKGILKLLLQGLSVRVDDLRQHPAFEGLPAGHLPIVSFLGLPLLYQGQVRGLLGVSNRATGPKFDASAEDLLGSFAAQATVSLENVRLFQEAQTRLDQTQILLRVSEATASTLDTMEVMRRISRAAAQALGADTTAAYLLDSTGRILQPMAGYHVPPDKLEVYQQQQVPVDRYPFIQAALQERRAMLTSHAALDPLYDEALWQLIPARSALLTPMIVKDEVIGVLWAVWWETAYLMTEEDRNLIEGIVRQAAIAIDSARLFGETERRAEELSVLHETSLQLAQEQQDLDTVLETTTQRAMELLNSDGGGVWLWREDDQELELAITFQVGNVDFAGRRLKPGEGLTGRAFATRTIQVVEDYPSWSGQSATFSDAPFASGLAAPMTWQAQVVGVLVATRSEAGHPYAEDEQNLAELLAAQAAAVIQNARLIEETRRRAEELSVLNELARALAAQLDVGQVLEQVYHGVSRLLDAANWYVGLYEPRTETVTFPLNVTESVLEKEIVSMSADEGITGYIIRTHEPVLIKEDVSSWLEAHGLKQVGEMAESWLGVPLMIGDEVLGVMAVQSFDVPGLYDEHDRDLMTAIASQAAVALQNVRLFEGTQQALEGTAMLFRVAQGLARAETPQEMFELVLTEYLAVLGLPQGGVMTLNPNGDQATLHTLVQNGRLVETPMTIPVTGNLPTERALETQEPVVIRDARHDELTASTRDLVDELGYRSLLLVPIIVRGEAIGLLGADSVGEIHEFTEREINLVRAVADQLGVALENQRLFEETQAALSETEALYRVARSVSAFESLPDTLQAVVDGVAEALPADRTALYVLDLSEQRVMHYAQGGPGAGQIDPVEFDELWEGLSGWVLREGQSAFSPKDVPDPRESEQVRRLRLERNSGSIIVAPMQYRGRVLGTLTAINRLDQPDFTERDVEMVSIMANQTAAAVENARLFEEAQTRAEEQTILRRITETVSSSLDSREMLTSALEGTRSAMRFDAGLIGLSDEQTGVLRLAAQVGLPEPLAHKLEQEGLAGTLYDYVFQTGQTVAISDVRQGAPVDVRGAIQYGLYAYASSPLVYKGERVGTFCFFNRSPRQMSARELSLLEALGNQVGLGVGNARLFEKSQSALAELEATQRMYLRQRWQDHLRQRELLQRSGFLYDATRADSAEEVIADPGLWRPEMERALAVGDLATVADSSADAPRTGLAIPITLRGQTIGVLGVESPGDERRWTDEDAALIQAVGDQLAQTLETARLFADTQRRAERERLIGEITSKIRASTDMRDILETTATELGQALGISQAMVRVGLAGLQAQPQDELQPPPQPAAKSGKPENQRRE